MYKLLSLFILSLIISSLNAQQGIGWVHAIGGTDVDGYSANVLTRSGLIVSIGITGSVNGDAVGNHGQSDVMLTAMNANGAIVWHKIIGGTADDGLNAVYVDTLTDGNIIAAFSSGSNNGDISGNHGGWDFVFRKYTPEGQLLWSKTYGGTAAEDLDEVRATTDGGCIAIGSTGSSNTGDVGQNHGNDDVWIIKLDQSGNLQWQKCYGGSSTDNGASIARAPDGGYFFAARTLSADGDLTGLVPAGTIFGGDMWLCKISSTGVIEWSRQIGGSGNEEGPNLLVVGSSVYLAFSSNSADRDIPSNIGLYDVALFKYTTGGTFVWKNIYASLSWDSPSSIEFFQNYISITAVCYATKFGGYSIPNPGGEGQGLLFRIDTLNGNLQWVRSYGGTQRDFASDHKIRPNGQFVISGQSASNDYDIYGNHGNYDGVVFVVEGGNRITGTVFIDRNNNSILDQGDSFVNLLQLTASRNDTLKSMTQSNNGPYTLEVETGEYVTKPTPYKNYYTFIPDTFKCTFTNNYQTFSKNIQVKAIAGKRDLRVWTVPRLAARPAFNVSYVLYGYNVGTDTVSAGSITWKKDPRITITNITPAPTATFGDSMVWNFTNFKPFEQKTIEINATTPPPPLLRVGDTLKYVARINPIAGDIDPIDNTLYMFHMLVGPRDPNAKINLNANGISENELKSDGWLNYVIQFQNVGTAPAFTVIVDDTLSSKLRTSTLEVLATSHPYEMQVKDSVIRWRFNDINLPDSVSNEKGSHGFIAYRIKAKPGLAVGDSIVNSAAIYFDYNDAVITNKDVVKVYRPEVVTAIPDIPENDKTIVVYPNPVDQSDLHVLNKQAGRYFRSWRLINSIGAIVGYQQLTQNGIQSLDIKANNLPTGVYILKLETNKGISFKRVVILN